MDWIVRLAEALGEPPPSEPEIDRLLEAARLVAHGVERKATPVAAYLLGVAAGRQLAAGASRDQAAEAVLATLAAVLPAGSGEGRSRPAG